MGEGYYGRNGTLGLATPQANPTAEIEFRALLPEGVGCATVRMASEASDPEARLRAYFTDIAETLSGPVLSSNICLAWATLQVAGIDLGALAPTPQMPLLAGWAPRIDQL